MKKVSLWFFGYFYLGELLMHAVDVGTLAGDEGDLCSEPKKTETVVFTDQDCFIVIAEEG